MTVRALFFMLLLCSVASAQETIVAKVGTPDFQVHFNDELYTRLVIDGKRLTPFEPTEYIRTPSGEVTEFTAKKAETKTVTDDIGLGQQTVIDGKSNNGLRKIVTVNSYKDYPNFVVFQVTYENQGRAALEISEWVNNGTRFELTSPSQTVWTFQGGSYEDRYDWVRPLEAGGGEDNFMGMNSTDYGGGVPVIDAWTQDWGLAVGVLELAPTLAKLPIDRAEDGSNVGLEVVQDFQGKLEPGDTLKTHRTFIAYHQGDYFNVLLPYREMLATLGLAYADYPESTYEPVWCGWGYERDVTLKQMLGSLAKAKKLGFLWAVLDDGWQTAEGDWDLSPDKFPGGDPEMKAFTEAVRAQGMRPKLWWAPLAVDPGTDLIKNHPEYLLLNEDGKPQEITWWDAYYLCPSYPPVHEYTRQLVSKMMTEWDFDGLKIDGQHLNAAPPCYNPAHNHPAPEVSHRDTPKFMKFIYDQAKAAKSDAVIEVCPCGTTYALHSLPFTNQPVSSDPESSFQIRSKAKTLKALMGRSVPYYGDHVELSDGGDDFASTIGVGGVIGSKFTLENLASKASETDLTSSKEMKWKMWSDIYSEHQLPKGEYRGELYDIGFDKPETHVVQKGEKLYFAFYAPNHQGTLELRGLGEQTYSVRDYVRKKDYGKLQGPQANLDVDFSGYLLLEATPEQP